MTYTWVRRRERKRTPYENPEGRRVNALAALIWNERPALYWAAKPGSLEARHLVAFLSELPAAPVPTIVVLDNGSIHRSKETRAAIPALRARGVHLYFLPAYSPELNAIESAFRAIKHHHLPERRYASLPALVDAVNGAFTAYEETLTAQRLPHLRPAA